jgi:hypothetical protein
MIKKLIFIMLCLLCIIDNLITQELLKWPIYMEGNPLAALAMSIPYGLWILKGVTLGLMIIFFNRISVSMMSIIVVLMFFVVSWNTYLTYKLFLG